MEATCKDTHFFGNSKNYFPTHPHNSPKKSSPNHKTTRLNLARDQSPYPKSIRKWSVIIQLHSLS